MSGVIGVFVNKPQAGPARAASDEAARLAYFGLHALQHRGQEAAGIAVGDGRTILEVKDLGLVAQVFKEADLRTLTGHIALGHAAYSTVSAGGEEPLWESAQPHIFSIGKQLLALAYNGNLINTAEVRTHLKQQDVRLSSDENAEAIAALVGEFTQGTSHIREGIARAMNLIRGSYAAGIITESALYAFRDPLGICPLCLGELPEHEGWVISSETTGLDIVGAHYLRDIAPGEIVKISEAGVETQMASPAPKPALCVFEYVYFARPDSEMAGLSMYEARRRLGEVLAREAPAEADLVLGVPDSGIPGAVGYAAASGIPYGEGLAKNRYVGRTFISPTQSLRQRGIRLKLNPMKHAIAGKSIVVVDDSIVRGNTSKQLVAMLREAGAREVHLRVTSPPVISPCYFGIDMSTLDQLIAAQKNVEEIRNYIAADSLAHLSIEGMVEATGMNRGDLCMACFDRNYPMEIGHREVEQGNRSRE